ncbi:cytochrome ubiquinol oxidase subunit I (plasmid) [Chimaeribacter arupi]|uniref:cytochrome ubiquinol oxidase subunit I n=1 Tax=Chimaeribacter arupi TaxID=2060066 RepID=UPI0027122047|nr:cytochrome ubiquinol oxidase subunit I [Chimaeribacter arupi]WKZ94414.1 cytochrome ubiquinol oxidase subunit I [Chimaeribacter arupi]
MHTHDLVLLISRAQFAFTIGFHIVLAALAIGLSLFLSVITFLWVRTRHQAYLDIMHFWQKIFALNMGVGVVTGVVMEFQFGTHWGPFTARAGAVIGPLMFYEVLVAFFIEAGFVGLMLFGLKKIGPRLHLCATLMVTVGAIVSAFWIVAANSWMQTPAGFALANGGRFVPTDWCAVIFTPSFPYRFLHMLLASVLGTALLIAACAAWHLLRDRHHPQARVMYAVSLAGVMLFAPLQILVGDLHGENTLAHQPQKVAAMEGSWQRPAPGDGEPLRLFALPDQQQQQNRAEVAIPHVGSLYLRHNLTGTITPLSAFPPADIPNVPLVFFAFRVMVGLGLLMALAAITGLVMWLRGRLFESRGLARLMVALGPAGFIAMLAGWVVTESGRQPFTVYGLMRTSESHSVLSLPLALAVIAVIAAVYLLTFGIGFKLLLRILGSRPKAGEQGAAPEMWQMLSQPEEK